MIPESELRWSKEALAIEPGEYEHYSGRRYTVIGVVRHSETLEEMVLYKALYGEGNSWVRPLAMFVGEVKVDGVRRRRFVRIV